MGDDVHYAYRFRAGGAFVGFNMGKAIRGTWRIDGDEFWWTQASRSPAEQCFLVERRGSSIRLLRDGYETFSAALKPIERRSTGGTRSQ